MIDVHGHVFNLAYVPVQGVLERRGVPGEVAGPAAIVLNAVVEIDSAPGSARVGLVPHEARSMAVETFVRMDYEETLRVTVEAASTERLVEKEDELDRALEAMREKGITTLSQELAPEGLGMEGLFDGVKRKFARLLTGMRGHLKGHATWFNLMLCRESEVATVMLRAYPGVELFVHHMMDMEFHYRDRSILDYVDDQIPRMRALSERHRGRLLAFVAFDPYREDGVEVVRAALDQGFAGVKFYPPSGYRPIGNTAEDTRGMDPQVVDQRNLALFRLCVERDVPLFTHCSPGGMESRDHSGLLSDPAGWAAVLESPGLGELRLCLGHAGGADRWLSKEEGDRGESESWVPRVIELCKNFPNVYCEIGHFDDVVRPESLARFTRRLVEAASEHPRLKDRMMYGSDYHLVVRNHRYACIPGVLARAFSDPGLSDFKERFFQGNAVQYLNLERWTESSGVTREERLRVEALLSRRPSG